MKNLERVKKLGLGILILLCLDIFVIKSNILIWHIVVRLYIFIMSLLLHFLNMEYIFLINWHQISQFFNQVIDWVKTQAKINLIFKRNVKMIIAVELEKYMTNSHILSIIIYKFRNRQKSYPIVLLLIDKNIKINFYYTILSLSLVICL